MTNSKIFDEEGWPSELQIEKKFIKKQADIILAFCEKLNPELSPREYDKIKDHHIDLP